MKGKTGGKKGKIELMRGEGSKEVAEAETTKETFKKGGHVKKYSHGGNVKGGAVKHHLGKAARGGKSPFTHAESTKGGAASDPGTGGGDAKTMDVKGRKRGGKC